MYKAKEKAFCNSYECNPKDYVGGCHKKKDVPLTQDWCPDCGSALVWKVPNSQPNWANYEPNPHKLEGWLDW
jgi:hypothetical protein